jgi:Tol biopolymer transport system component
MRHLSAPMSAKNTLWMCVALAAGILAAFLVVVLGTPTKPAEAAFPGNNGKIVFVNTGPNVGYPQIYTMKANGDNKTRLTNSRNFDGSPAFSANGKKIAFESDQDIYTMSATGTDKKNVTRSNNVEESDPAWSPDGTRIAFASSSTGNTDIYVINKDGTGLTRLTTSPKVDIQPAWSPDGTKIAFVRQHRGNSSNLKIYVMKAARESETNRAQRLTTASLSTLEELDPAWSPDGTRIAFARNPDASSPTSGFDLHSIRANGSGQIRLTTSGGSQQPAWSPDGTKIAFRGFRENDSGIFVIKAAPESATNLPKQLAGKRSPSFEPDWQPLP